MADRAFIVVGALLALLLQLFVAPYIAVFSGIPNFVVVFTVLIAVLRPHSFSCLLPFALGLAFDFAGGAPVGAMAFCLTLFTYLLALYCEHAANDSVFMSLAFVALGLLVVELSYVIFLLLFGYNANLFDALAYRMAPCFLYDLVVAFILYPLLRRFVQPPAATRTDITQLR